jgi:hypothetical protein
VLSVDVVVGLASEGEEGSMRRRFPSPSPPRTSSRMPPVVVVAAVCVEAVCAVVFDGFDGFGLVEGLEEGSLARFLRKRTA